MRSLLYLVVGTGLTVAGFTSGTFSTLVDYGTVGWQRASTWVEENIPLEDELAVLELNVKKLDAEIDSNAKLVAGFEVELEQSQRSLEKGEAVQKELGTGLDALGQKYVTMIDGSHREQVSQTLRRGTEHFKVRAQTLTAQRDAITRKQESLDKLKAGFEQQKHDRGLMKLKSNACGLNTPP